MTSATLSILRIFDLAILQGSLLSFVPVAGVFGDRVPA